MLGRGGGVGGLSRDVRPGGNLSKHMQLGARLETHPIYTPPIYSTISSSITLSPPERSGSKTPGLQPKGITIMRGSGALHSPGVPASRVAGAQADGGGVKGTGWGVGWAGNRMGGAA